MPRTNAVAPPGCSPVRLFSFDCLGLIKVLESSGETGHPQVVARWGEPNPQKSILCVSLSSEVLAVARKNKTVEIMDPSSGSIHTEIDVTSKASANADDSVHLVGVHLLRTDESRILMTCTNSGNATLRAVSWGCKELDDPSSITWQVCKTGSILCSKVDISEKYAAFGGDGVEPSVWDINHQTKTWEAKAPRRDSMGLMSPPFVTSSTFLGNDHHRLIVGTGHHQIRLYDISVQRRPMLSFEFLDAPIKAVEADCDGHYVFAGTGNGGLASFDMRTGKLLGVFKGKCSGSIRSIAKHPTLPIIATCGLDRYLNVFHTTTRQLLSRVFLKQQLVAVMFDNSYTKSSENTYTSNALPMEDTRDAEPDLSIDGDISQKSMEQMRRKRKPKKNRVIEESLKRKKKNEDELNTNVSNANMETEKENKGKRKHLKGVENGTHESESGKMSQGQKKKKKDEL